MLPPHTYEEIREIVIDILLGREKTTYDVQQWVSLLSGVGEVFARRLKAEDQRLDRQDAELVRDVFWDLFRQGFITLGVNHDNPMWPFFRLSHFGQQTLQSDRPYRFHDTTSFLAMVRAEVPDVSPEAIAYLDEAVSAFYSGCLLASSVMLGVAAEAEFLRLVDVASASPTYGSAFSPIQNQRFIRQKITAFQSAIAPHLKHFPREAIEDLDANFNMIQSVLRIARNEAGHPTALIPRREQVYVNLQLFVPFVRQLMKLRYTMQ